MEIPIQDFQALVDAMAEHVRDVNDAPGLFLISNQRLKL
jgi:hypothetical protein